MSDTENGDAPAAPAPPVVPSASSTKSQAKPLTLFKVDESRAEDAMHFKLLKMMYYNDSSYGETFHEELKK